VSSATMTRLRDLGDWSGGNTPSKANAAYWTDGTIPWVSPKDMKVDEITSSEDRVSELALAEGRVSLLPEGSVLVVTRSGILSHTLPVAVTKTPVTINQDLKALTPKEGVLPKYVAHALRGASRRILKECSKHGTTVASIETNALLDFEISLVDLDEQRRIVAELDKQFSRLDEAVANLKRVKDRLVAYKGSIISEAVGGRVTVDDGSAPTGWRRCLLGDATAKITSGSRDWSPYYGRGASIFLLAQNVRPMSPDFSVVQHVDPPEADPAKARSRVQRGDLLVTIVGANTGQACMVGDLPGETFVCQSVALVRPVLAASAPYLNLWLNSPEHGRRYLDRCMYGQGRPHLGFEQLASMPIAIPPPDEQARIVAEVDRRLSIVREVEAEVDANLKRAQALRQAVLARAFSAER
jgi:type I restriction enzyme, S subunit